MEYRRAAFLTLGCKVNQYETDAMEEILEKNGYEIVGFKEYADVYVVNTCSVTNIADRKSRQMIRRARKSNPDAVVVAAGCYVQSGEETLRETGIADILLGNNRKNELADVLDEYFAEKEGSVQKDLSGTMPEKKVEKDLLTKKTESGLFPNIGHEPYDHQGDPRRTDKKRLDRIIDMNHTSEYESMELHHVNEHTRAYIKVQDGCNQFCSYCIIPYTRGRIRSEKPEAVLREVRDLAKRGYREIVLTGIHLTSYGLDFDRKTARSGRSPVSEHGEMDYLEMEQSAGISEEAGSISESNLAESSGDVAGYRLIHLIEAIQKIEGIERIRLGSLEPRVITKEFVTRLKNCDKVCPHFHLSLQSGCDETLRRMNRHYSTREYRDAVQLLRQTYEHPALTTDVIAGFVGETEEEFQETCTFLEEIELYEMHVFKYSVRSGTRAEHMSGHVSEDVKNVRSARLLGMAARHKEDYESWYLGRKAEVLLEEKVTVNGKDYLQGYTRNYVKIAIECTKEAEKLSQNDVAFVEIVQFIDENLMLGKLSIE